MFEAAKTWVPLAEYLEFEERSDQKSEYFDGHVFAMAGGTPEHNLVGTNLIRELGNQLEEKPCRVFGSDQRIRIPATGLDTYPDISVICGELERDDEDPRALRNPVVIIEVLSESTEAYDRGDKFAHYQTLASLQEYILVASDRPRIERFTRRSDGSGWLYEECADASGAVALASIGCSLSVIRSWSKMYFPKKAPGRRRGPARATNDRG